MLFAVQYRHYFNVNRHMKVKLSVKWEYIFIKKMLGEKLWVNNYLLELVDLLYLPSCSLLKSWKNDKFLFGLSGWIEHYKKQKQNVFKWLATF